MDRDNAQFSDLMSLGSLALKEPRLLIPSAWLEHIPFAFWLVEHHRPGTIVELGVHTGSSYCAFCQAVVELGLESRCYGVDTFEGDANTGRYGGSRVLEELRAYHDPLYAGFSSLIHGTFDEALKRFADGTVDLLHIDGCHSYETVKHDFETWMPKLSQRGIVLFHDTNEYQPNFGVFKLWAELEDMHPSFEFFHGHGLGVLAVGRDMNPAMSEFFSSPESRVAALRQFFSMAGSRFTLKIEIEKISSEAAQQIEEIKRASTLENRRKERIRELEARVHGRMGRIEYLEKELLAKFSEIEGLETTNRKLAGIIGEAEVWQRSWFKRAFRRWRRDAGQKRDGLLLRFEKSVRKRRDLLLGKIQGRKTNQESPPAVVETKSEESRLADHIMKVMAPWFDREFYLLGNPDVAQEGMDPLQHFYADGEREGRMPRADFDPVFYLANNPDVKQVKSDDPLESSYAKHPFFHYVAVGKKEGREGAASK